MAKKNIIVEGAEIRLLTDKEDFISLTDLTRFGYNPLMLCFLKLESLIFVTKKIMSLVRVSRLVRLFLRL
jgi:hypothetical protein